MTYRERRERRAERREDWAASRRRKASGEFERVSEIADRIPLGQPILVGHHSERGARRDQERITRGMSRGVEHQRVAERHDQAADTIRRQLDRSIYRDDPDAVERLEEKLRDLVARRDRMKAINDWFRRNRKAHGLGDRLVCLEEPETDAKFRRLLEAAHAALTLTVAEVRDIRAVASFNRLLRLDTSNVTGNIARTRKRLQEAKGR